MSADLYTSIHGQLFRISTFPCTKGDAPKFTALNDHCLYTRKANGPSSSTQTLLAEGFQFSTKNGKFEPHGDGVTLTLAGSDIRLVALATVFEDLSGLKVPCVVVEQQEQAVIQQDSQHKLIFSGAGDELRSSQMYRMSVILLSSTKRKFVVHGSFNLGYSFQSAAKVFIQDGPNICWEREGCVYITQAFSQSSRTEVDVVKLDACLWKPLNILKWVGVINGDAVAVGTELFSGQGRAMSGDIFCDLDHKWVVVKLPVAKAGGSNAPMADEKGLMPHEYSYIVNCVHSQRGSFSQSGNGRLKSCDQGLVFLAATNQSQLIESIGGVVRRVCRLPFSDGCQIAVAMVTGGEELIVVHSSCGTVCAVWKKTFEIAAEWTGFHSLLVDDFVFSGADQILLLGDCKDAHQNCFNLTDLGTCNWTTKENDDLPKSKTLSTCAENLMSAVQALEVQIQTGMEALRMSESRCNLKAQLIQQSQDALYNMMGQLPSPASPSTSLVCFCSNQSHEDSIMETGEENASMIQHATLRCLSCWQRVAMERWIIGVEVDNQTSRCISDIYISLIPASTTQSSLCSSTSSCFFKSVVSSAASKLGSSRHGMNVQCEPLSMRLKQDHRSGHRSGGVLLEPGQTATVTGATDIPEFAFQHFAECSVILHWKEWLPHNSGSGTGEISGSALDKFDFVHRRCTCSHTVLYVSDVVSGKLGINLLDTTKSESECQHDIQSLDAIQQATPLCLTSKYSNLKFVEGFLKDGMGFRNTVMHDVLMGSSGALALTRVQIVSRDGPFRMAMNVYSRNQSELLLLCQHLYQLLPDDVIIKPLLPTNQIRSAMATAVTAIDRELKQTSSHLQQLILNQSVSTVRGHDEQDTAADGNSAWTLNMDKLAKARGNFERERHRWHDSGVNVEVNISDEAQTWRQELLDARINTDTDVNTLASLLALAN